MNINVTSTFTYKKMKLVSHKKDLDEEQFEFTYYVILTSLKISVNQNTNK